MLSAFDLYELAVTNPGPLAAFLDAAWRRVKGQRARSARTQRPMLREDFSGSAALARAWVRGHGEALAVDLNKDALAYAAREKGLSCVRSDVMACGRKADIIAATNFPLGYWHTRDALLGYLRHTRACLLPGGVFCADTYGGSDAFKPLCAKQHLRGPAGEFIEYTWEQVAAYPQTRRVENALHFAVRTKRSGRAVHLRNAFRYDWRLWSIPELSDALLEAGFAGVEVYDRLGEAIDEEGVMHIRPLEADEAMDDPYVVYVVGRK